jgi:hypothetical protein
MGLLRIFVLFAMVLIGCSPATSPAQFAQFDILMLSPTLESGDGLLSPAHLNQKVGAQIVSDWEAVTDAYAAGNLDALILPSATVDLVELDQLSNMYRDGVLIVAFNTYAPTMAKILQDYTFNSGNWINDSDVFQTDFFIMAVRQSREDGASFSGAQNTIANLSEFDRFASILALKLERIDLPRGR